MLNIRILILQAKISEAENWLLERIGDLKIDDMTFEKIHSGILTFQKKKKKKKILTGYGWRRRRKSHFCSVLFN